MASRWNSSGTKYPLTSWDLLSIFAALNNAVAWVFSNRLLISKSFTPCTNPLVTAQSTLVIIGATVTLMFHNFFLFTSNVSWLTTLFTFFQFYPGVSWNRKVPYSAGFFFVLSFFLLSLDLTAWPRLGGLFVSQNPREVCSSHFPGRFIIIIFLSLFIYLLLRVFHIIVSWWSFTEVWETASLLKSPGVFSVFWPFSIMM